jgi:hypothetical protein
LLALVALPAHAFPPSAEEAARALMNQSRTSQYVVTPQGSTASTDAIGDGIWQELAPPERSGAAAVYDPTGDRLILLGGGAGQGGFNDTWILPLAGAPSWNQMATAGNPPAQLSGNLAFYDSLRSRIVLVDPSATVVSFLSLPTAAWTTLTFPPLSGVTFGWSISFDPIRNRLLMFGGATVGLHAQIIPANDVRSLSLTDGATWTLQSPGGVIPPARYGHAAIYDPVRDRVVVFGGHSSAGPLLDTWALSIGDSMTWSQLTPTGIAPTEPTDVPAIYDPVGDAMIVFGSTSSIGLLSLSGQGQWSSAVQASTAPTARTGAAVVVLDPVRHHLVLAGGAPDGGNAWTFDLNGPHVWNPLVQTPPAHVFPTAIRDVPGDRLVMFGGLIGNPLLPSTNDTWVKGLGDDGTWQQLAPGGALPAPRNGHTAVYDPQNQRMVVFGGADQGYFNDTWSLSLAGFPTWTQLHPAGSLPAPRWGHSAIYDPIGKRMLVFGGGSTGTGNGVVVLNDVWSLSLNGPLAWTPVYPAGLAPTPRGFVSLLFDSRRNRAIAVGGIGATNPPPGDVWALNLVGDPQWTQLNTVGSPGGFAYQAAIYDSVSDRIVVYEGENSSNTGVWALSLSPSSPTWSQLQPSGIGPELRVFQGALFDNARQRMTMTNGQGSNYLTDTWALAWPADLATATELSLVSADATPTDVRLAWYSAGSLGEGATLERRSAETVWAAIGTVTSDGTGRITFDDRTVTPGARYGYRLQLASSRSADTATEVWVVVPNVALLSLRGSWPNPSRGDPRIVFSLPDDTAASIEIFDVSGKRRLTREVGSFGPGEHVLSLLDTGLSPGMYFVRLNQARESRTTRIVVTR